jgi:hypothetical protein
MQNLTQNNTILVNGANLGLTMGVQGAERGLATADSLRRKHEFGKRPCPAFSPSWPAHTVVESTGRETTRGTSLCGYGEYGFGLHAGLSVVSASVTDVRRSDDCTAITGDTPAAAAIPTVPAPVGIAQAAAAPATTAPAMAAATRPPMRGHKQVVATLPAPIWAALVLSRALSS